MNCRYDIYTTFKSRVITLSVGITPKAHASEYRRDEPQRLAESSLALRMAAEAPQSLNLTRTYT